MGGPHKRDRERFEAIKKNGYKVDLDANPTHAEKIAYFQKVISENIQRLENPEMASAKTLKKAQEIVENAILALDRLIEDSKSKGV